MRNEECPVYAKLEYVTMDTDGNIVIGLSKKTKTETITKILKDYEGMEVNVIVIPVER